MFQLVFGVNFGIRFLNKPDKGNFSLPNIKTSCMRGFLLVKEGEKPRWVRAEWECAKLL